ncbi:MAG: N-acetyltransferase [Variibacter sp.]|nr:N-acetyltransferase [Variibacter sp.]
MSQALTRTPTRYERDLGGGAMAFARVREEGGVVTVYHTEVPRDLQGQGHGARFIAAVLDDIRARGLKVVPRCPFAAAFIRNNPAYADLVA